MRVVTDSELAAGPLEEVEHFERLVEAYGARVHAYLARRAPGGADDLLAEVWLAAYSGRRSFDPGRGDLGGWLFGIARNVLMSHQRAERRRTAREGLAQAATSAQVDEWSAVDARLDAAGSATALRAALAALPTEEREVLLLVAWEQLTPTEVAAVLDIPPGTARSRLHRARKRIAAEWDSAADDHEREAIA